MFLFSMLTEIRTCEIMFSIIDILPFSHSLTLAGRAGWGSPGHAVLSGSPVSGAAHRFKSPTEMRGGTTVGRRSGSII